MGEGEEDTAIAAASAHRQVMRIYIGGVGPSVTTADVEKTFSSLGHVAGVEFVRTNGRNFAYMNFEPSSEKTLAKLFSTYNGCTWKGGKLKLERAKEHYLDRLKREWAEDAKPISDTLIDPKMVKAASNSKLERLSLENMQLRIFFPKLRKVKPLPFKGAGKHKYSFQRIEVPPLPIHFCDCEEHRESSETASHKFLSAVNSGIHYEKELSIMDSVMNKLFEKGSNELTADREKMLATSENASDPSVNDIHEEESEEEMEIDADNLVTNIGMGRRDGMLSQLGGDTRAVNQESRVSRHQSSKNELSRNKANGKKRLKTGPAYASEVAANKRAHLELPVKITDEFTAVLPRKTGSECHSQEPQISVEPPINKGQTEPGMIPAQSTKGQSWLQKSSWKDLVVGTGKTSFSITNVLPDTGLLQPTKPKSSGSATNTLTEAKKIKAQPDKKSSRSSPTMQDPSLQKENTKKGQKAGPSDASEITVTSPSDASEVTANKNVHLELSVKNTENEFTAMLSPNSSAEGHSQEPEVLAEPPLDKSHSEPSIISTQSTKGQSWLQKSSWKDLIGDMESSSFSITNVVPDISSLQPTQPKSSDSATDTLTEEKKIKAHPERKISETLLTVHDPRTSLAMQDPPPRKEADDYGKLGKGDCSKAHAGGDEHKAPGAQEQRRRPEVGTSNVCTFMRSDESLKQWAQAKAALSRHLNKKMKKREDDSPKSMKGALSRKR